MPPGRDAASPARAGPLPRPTRRARGARPSRSSCRSSEPGVPRGPGFRLLRRIDVVVDAHDLPLAGIELALVTICGVGDLALRVPLPHRGDHAAAAIDLVEVAPDLTLHLVRQRLHEPGPTKRIDRGVHAGLGRDDLLLAEREQGGLGGRHGERLVVGVGVE